MNMSVALGKLVKYLEELKKEVKVPNVDEAKQEAFKEIENYPEYDKKILSIIIEKTMGNLSEGISLIKSFFASSTNKPVEIIDKLIEEANHGRELLQHQYTPVIPLELQSRTQEVSTDSMVYEEDFKTLKRRLGEISYDAISKLRESGVKEIGYKEVYDMLPEDIRKIFRSESADTRLGIFKGLSKALRNKEIKRVSEKGIGKLAKYELVETRAITKESETIMEQPKTEIGYTYADKEIRTIIRDIKPGVLFSNDHIRSSLSPSSKKLFEGKPKYLSAHIWWELNNAEKEGEVKKEKKGTYRRLDGEEIEEEKESSSEERLTETGKRTYYKISKEVFGIIGGFDPKENFSPKNVIEHLSEDTKKYYEGKEEYLEKKVSALVVKATKKGIIEKLGYGTYKKIAKSKESQADYIIAIENIERGKEITTEDVYESLPPNFRAKYPSLKGQKTVYALFYLVDKAKEKGIIEDTGRREGSRKVYRRV